MKALAYIFIFGVLVVISVIAAYLAVLFGWVEPPFAPWVGVGAFLFIIIGYIVWQLARVGLIWSWILEIAYQFLKLLSWITRLVSRVCLRITDVSQSATKRLMRARERVVKMQIDAISDPDGDAEKEGTA